MSTDLADFKAARRANVLRVLAGSSVARIDRTSFFHSLPGYWPPDVVTDVKDISSSAPEHAEAAARLLDQCAGPALDPDQGDMVRRVLPVPHPLDADWRFTPRTRERLLDVASRYSPRRETLLLGTPSIFAHMCTQLDLRKAVLVDANLATVAAARGLAEGHSLLKAHHADLVADPDIGLTRVFDTVIADPPWYFDEHRSFLDASSALLVPGGTVLMVAAPKGTRPTADFDRAEVLAHAERAGFELVRTMTGGVEFTSSPFERAALRECGVPGVPTNWRRADLLILKKTTSTPTDCSTLSGRSSPWVEVPYGRSRLRVRAEKMVTPLGSSTITGGISRSVSRLAPERKSANLWTTGNAAFAVGPEIVDALQHGDPSWHRTLGGGALGAHLDAEQVDLRAWGWL